MLTSYPAIRRFIAALAVAGAIATPAVASLDPGQDAPEFAAEASLNGKLFTFSLSDALKQGPVVVYFYPAAFTKGCNIEAHKFANAMPEFKALGAQVIGMSADDLETLHKFAASPSECNGKFPVAADPGLKIAKSYDATLLVFPGHADRTSYVITPDHKVLYAYSAMSPDKHVENTLNALREWRQSHPLEQVAPTSAAQPATGAGQ
jgi:peroxiredoxin